MKLKLLSLIFFLTLSISNAQLKPILITFKNGETLKGIGKKKNYTVKYKTDENANVQEFEFSRIKSVEIEVSYDEKTVLKFFQVKNSENYIAVKELVIGNKAELYTTSMTNSSSGMRIGGMSGMESQSTTFYHYYIKKPNEEKLTYLGVFHPLSNNLKLNVKEYFKECKSLSEKLENREFKVSEGVEEIVKFYNNSCE
jgi:hypothetical protein